jgi:hypothetical protein
VIVDIIMKDMKMGRHDSHDDLCGDFLDSEVESAMKKNKVEYTK